VAALAVCVAAYAVLLGAFRLLNAPSNSAVVAGVAVIFALLVIVPVAVTTIWRKL
jgi:heme/copper-type cytochrome/quinol oxidase subunit 4